MRRRILLACCMIGLVYANGFAGASITVRVGDSHRCHNHCRHNRPVIHREVEWKWFSCHSGSWVLKHREIRYDAGWDIVNYGPWHIEFTGSTCYHAHGRWYHHPGGHRGCRHHSIHHVKHHHHHHYHDHHHHVRHRHKHRHARRGGGEVHYKYEYEGRHGSYEYEFHKVKKGCGRHDHGHHDGRHSNRRDHYERKSYHRDHDRSNHRDRITPGYRSYRKQKPVRRPSIRDVPGGRVNRQTASRHNSSNEDDEGLSIVSIRKVGIR